MKIEPLKKASCRLPAQTKRPQNIDNSPKWQLGNSETATERRRVKNFLDSMERAKIIYLEKYVDDSSKVCDIYSKGEYPSNALSNFYPHEITVRGVKCNSMEGFLQSLKFRSKRAQERVRLLTGADAKAAGSRKKLWKRTGYVYFQGKRIKLRGFDFYRLILSAYTELNDNEHFRKALKATRGSILEHSIGNDDEKETILTRKEFLGLLYLMLYYNDN